MLSDSSWKQESAILTVYYIVSLICMLYLIYYFLHLFSFYNYMTFFLLHQFLVKEYSLCMKIINPINKYCMIAKKILCMYVFM